MKSDVPLDVVEKQLLVHIDLAMNNISSHWRPIISAMNSNRPDRLKAALNDFSDLVSNASVCMGLIATLSALRSIGDGEAAKELPWPLVNPPTAPEGGDS